MDIEFYNLLWAVIIVVVPPVMKKLWNILVESVWVKEYYNVDKVFVLTEVEGVGTLFVHILAIITSVVLNTVSEEGIPLLNNYVTYWLVWSIPYIIIIIEIVKKKTEHGKKRYVWNVFLAMMVNLFMGIDLFITPSDNYKLTYTLILITIVILIFVYQIKINVQTEEIKEVTYTVRTKNRKIPYTVHKKPIKSGKYFYISITDSNNEEAKRIQIPESEILEIVYDIKKISGK